MGTAAQSAPMTIRRFNRMHAQLALWGIVFALLLKAAVPMLASTAAQWQGKPLAEVCTVYGVATVTLAAGGGEPQPGHAGKHGGDHCALSAVGGLAVLQVHVVAWPAQTPRAGVPSRPCSRAAPPDGCAAWVAGLKHGPPPVS